MKKQHNPRGGRLTLEPTLRIEMYLKITPLFNHLRLRNGRKSGFGSTKMTCQGKDQVSSTASWRSVVVDLRIIGHLDFNLPSIPGPAGMTPQAPLQMKDLL